MTVDYDTLDPLVRRDSYQEVSALETGEVHFKVIKNASLLRLFWICGMFLSLLDRTEKEHGTSREINKRVGSARTLKRPLAFNVHGTVWESGLLIHLSCLF